MTFLDFYVVDLTIILIILLITGITFSSINYIDPDEENIGPTGKIIYSFITGVLVSILYSYGTLENDALLKENFWD
jgi:Na+-translocating ferredoxin:NAD+ oxidoreductase RnfD subunit|tara:strand:+ start:7261 stop:7488 length:228 start_codon:yes stop_codon:yes gene_type:complete